VGAKKSKTNRWEPQNHGAKAGENKFPPRKRQKKEKTCPHEKRIRKKKTVPAVHTVTLGKKKHDLERGDGGARKK